MRQLVGVVRRPAVALGAPFLVTGSGVTVAHADAFGEARVVGGAAFYVPPGPTGPPVRRPPWFDPGPAQLPPPNAVRIGTGRRRAIAVTRAPFVLRGLGETAYIDPATGGRISGEGSGSGSSTGKITPNPTGPPVSIYEGTLVAVVNTAPVYLVQNGQKCFLDNLATYVAMGYSTARNSSGGLADVNYISQADFDAIPTGPPMPDLSGSAATIITPTTTATSAIQPVDTTSPSNINVTPTGVVASAMQTGAVWDAALGGYLNPDGSVYYGTTATAATSTFDLTSPSTWPTWVWIVGVGGIAFLMFKKR